MMREVLSTSIIYSIEFTGSWMCTMYYKPISLSKRTRVGHCRVVSRILNEAPSNVEMM